MRVIRRPAARVLCVAEGRFVLLLRWRDPGSGVDMWEPPGGGVEPGETPEEAARRELSEETGLVVASLAGPVSVTRDFVWDGMRRVGEEPFYLAAFDEVPTVRLEPEPALLGYAWLDERAVGGLDVVEPPGLVDVLTRLRTARPSPPSR
jgi:8-oxo-dGTP pyrophosphatase MutT (NUDIX family)